MVLSRYPTRAATSSIEALLVSIKCVAIIKRRRWISLTGDMPMAACTLRENVFSLIATAFDSARTVIGSARWSSIQRSAVATAASCERRCEATM